MKHGQVVGEEATTSPTVKRWPLPRSAGNGRRRGPGHGGVGCCGGRAEGIRLRTSSGEGGVGARAELAASAGVVGMSAGVGRGPGGRSMVGTKWGTGGWWAGPGRERGLCRGEIWGCGWPD